MEEREVVNNNEEVVEEVVEEEVNENKKEVEEKEIQELKDSLQRLQADFNNYRRRVEKEKKDISVFANEKIVLEILPIIDNMERALSSSVEEKESSIYKGVELVLKQLVDTLSKFGVEEIKAEDSEFDPNLHYAVMQEEVEGMDSNKVIEVLQKGYKLSDKVIRPAMVKVSK
ncbi:nucleotide exchange factor GrpE [Tepidibacter thalassicus]|uniref:nucleotide exchange factor GrpE n=1 Tax=Tepidibacter thalassicus TaxID=214905 RepID=UPI0011602CC1|nr:nucleotide exchange factor GrpE [Tepidibacter thalassicus]